MSPPLDNAVHTVRMAWQHLQFHQKWSDLDLDFHHAQLVSPDCCWRLLQGILTPAGLCCNSEAVDECGVCDGINACKTVGYVDLDTASSAASRRRLQQVSEADQIEAMKAALCRAVGRRRACDSILYTVTTTDAGYFRVRQHC
jgi:hypothetical protein